MNLSTEQRETHRLREQLTVTSGSGEWEGNNGNSKTAPLGRDGNVSCLACGGGFTGAHI